MKKTLFLTHVGNPGGAEIKMIKLCEALGVQAEVLHLQHGTLDETLRQKNIRAHVMPMPQSMSCFRREDGLKGIFKAVPATLSMLGKMARHMRGFDVVVCMSQKSFILSTLIRPFSGTPIIWFMNDILSKEHFNPLLIRLLICLSRLTARHVVVNSRASYDAWIESGGKEKNVHIIYSGIDLDGFDASLRDTATIEAYRKRFSPDGRPLVGVFGRISPWKGQDVFLRALGEISAVAVIVGDAQFGEQEYAAELKRLAATPALQGRVTFAGHIDEVEKVMAACDVIVHCSTSPEPFGRVIVEALSTRTPVIASDAGGPREIVDHGLNGQLTPMGDIPALSTAIRFYLDDPATAKTMALQGRRKAEELFSSKAMVEKFRAIMKELCTV